MSVLKDIWSDFLQRVFHLLVAVDQLLWVVITLGHGYPDETISSASWRYEQKGNPIAKVARPAIDWMFSWYEEEHCYLSYLSEVNRTHIFKQRP